MRETRLSLAGYLDRLRRFPTMTMTKGRPRARDPNDTVATTWQLSLERVRPTPGAVALLEVCAFLDPEEIPRELFGRHLDPPAADLAVLAEDPFALDDAVAALRRFGLVKADEQSLTVHRLLQQVVGSALDPATKAARVGVAVRLVDRALPFGGHVDPRLWPVCARLLPHAPWLPPSMLSSSESSHWPLRLCWRARQAICTAGHGMPRCPPPVRTRSGDPPGPPGPRPPPHRQEP